MKNAKPIVEYTHVHTGDLINRKINKKIKDRNIMLVLVINTG